MPLDATPVDVTALVRRRPSPKPAPGEQGVTCAVRAGVPVVVAGRTALNPFAELGGAAGRVRRHRDRFAVAVEPATCRPTVPATSLSDVVVRAVRRRHPTAQVVDVSLPSA